MFPGPTELIVILLIAVVVFGPKRIPEIMGGIGQGIRTFKKSMEGEESAPEPPQTENAPPTDQPLLQASEALNDKKVESVGPVN